MTIEQLNTLKIGSIVFIVINTGAAGIFKYQYIGIVKSSFNNLEYHVFLSEHFVSTVCIEKGKEKTSSSIKNIFTLEADAKQRQKEMREEENIWVGKD